MSASAHKASLQFSNGMIFYFNTLRSEEGGPPDEPEMVQEEMSGGGADGSRFRDIHLQFRPWIFSTSDDGASLDVVDAMRRQYERVQQLGLVGTMRLERGGIFRTYRHLKVISVGWKTLAGSSTGYGSATVSNALLYATWQTKFMKPQSVP